MHAYAMMDNYCKVNNSITYNVGLYLRLSKEDESSAPTLRWLMRDITRRVNAERALVQKSEQVQLLEEIASAANLANSVEDALQFAVDRICAFTGWPVGHVYLTQSIPTPVLNGFPLSLAGRWRIFPVHQYARYLSLLKPG
jgi:PAS domain-containing protein